MISENDERGDVTVRTDPPDRGRGLNLFGAFLAATGIRAISRRVARICGSDAGDNTEAVEAFCLRCRVKSPMKKAVAVTLANGSDAMQGDCLVCGTRMSRIMKRA